MNMWKGSNDKVTWSAIAFAQRQLRKEECTEQINHLPLNWFTTKNNWQPPFRGRYTRKAQTLVEFHYLPPLRHAHSL